MALNGKKFWPQLLEKFGWNKKKVSTGEKEMAVYNISDPSLTHCTKLEFQRWASDNQLSSHTLDTLANYHFVSLPTVSALHTDLVESLGLEDDQCYKLRGALNQLHAYRAEDVLCMEQMELASSKPADRTWMSSECSERPVRKRVGKASERSVRSTGDIQQRVSECDDMEDRVAQSADIQQRLKESGRRFKESLGVRQLVKENGDAKQPAKDSPHIRQGVKEDTDIQPTIEESSINGHHENLVNGSDVIRQSVYDSHQSKDFGKQGTIHNHLIRPGLKTLEVTGSLPLPHKDQIESRTGSINCSGKREDTDEGSRRNHFHVDANSNRLFDSLNDQEGVRCPHSLANDVMSFEIDAIQHLLELMVETKIINDEIQLSVLSETSDVNIKRHVQTLLKMTDHIDIQNLERRLGLRLTLRHHTADKPNDVMSENRQVARPCKRRKRKVTFEPTAGELGNSVSPRSAVAHDDDNYVARTSGISNSNFNLDAEIFIDSNSHWGEQVNPYFEYTDGRDELPKAVLQVFGQKGRDYGKLQDASSVVCTESGDVIVTDFINGKVQVFDCTGQPSTEIRIKSRRGPWNVAMSPYGWIAVTYRGSRKLTVISHDGEEMFSAEGDIFESPAGLAVDLEGRFIVTDTVSNGMYRIWCEEHTLMHSECLHSKGIELKQPRYVTVSPMGQIIVSDTGNHCVKILTPDGHLERSFGQYGRRPGDFRSPYAVCCDHRGNIIVADHYNNRVSMFSSSGNFLRHLLSKGHGLNRPQGLHISADRKLYVTHGQMKANEVLVYDLTEGTSSRPTL